jgi:hypothetical protein
LLPGLALFTVMQLLWSQTTAADQQRDDVIGQIAGHREFTSMQRGVAQTIESVFGEEFKRDEIAPGRAANHFRVSESAFRDFFDLKRTTIAANNRHGGIV